MSEEPSAGLSSVSRSSHPSKSSVIRKVGTGSFTKNLPEQRCTKWGGGGLPKIKLTQFYYCCHTKAIGSNVCAKKCPSLAGNFITESHTQTSVCRLPGPRVFSWQEVHGRAFEGHSIITNDLKNLRGGTVDQRVAPKTSGPNA